MEKTRVIKSNIIILFITVMLVQISGCGAKKQTHDNLKNFQFTCVHEKDVFPPLDPQADNWFKQAVQLSEQDKPNFNQIV